MIIKMKKVSLVTLDSHREESLIQLRDQGVVHLELTSAQNERVADLREKREMLQEALRAVPRPEKVPPYTGKQGMDDIVSLTEELHDLSQLRDRCIVEIERIGSEKEQLDGWGDFESGDMASLRDQGVDIRLYDISREEMSAFPDGVYTFIISETKSRVKIAAVAPGNSVEIPIDQAALPERSLSRLEHDLRLHEKELQRVNKKLEQYADRWGYLQWGLQCLEAQMDFENARAGLAGEGALAYITGYVPERDLEGLKEAAARHHWALMITDPGDDDMVPTLVENPKWIRPIKPVFNLLGTVPGYREFDISPWFLMFFSVFWAMIVGDAGYGAIFLLLTIIGRITFRKAPSEPFILLFITSITTIAWGGVTGTWFGIEALSRNPALSWMIIPSVASFSSSMAGETDKILMHLCFIIGAVHLSVAHLIQFARMFPSLRSYAELGRLSMIWGLYFLIRNLVLKIDLHPASLWLLGVGFGMVIIFTEQNGNFVKGIIKGLSNLIVISLGSVGFFSDVVSYVRLFAVGLATLEVAKSFNGMAAGFGSGIFAIGGAVLVLFFGHTLNIVLCCMSLIVHGIRLNMLEFSGHLGMEWSGNEYRPFKGVKAYCPDEVNANSAQ